MSEQVNVVDRYYVSVKKIWEKPTVKRFSTATATLSLVAFFLLVALKPTIETIFTLNKKISDEREIESMMTKKIADLNTAFNTYQQIQPDLPLLDQYYPKTAEAKNLIAILSQNSTTSNMSDLSYTFSPYTIASGSGQIQINFNGQNKYLNVINFLDNIINARRLIVLTGVSMSQGKTGDKLNVTINTNAYYENSSGK